MQRILALHPLFPFLIGIRHHFQALPGGNAEVLPAFVAYIAVLPHVVLVQERSAGIALNP